MVLLADPQLSARDVLRIFHGDEPFLFLGAAFTTIGLLCAALSLLRRRFDAMLLWLAAFAFLYGQRLWLDTGLLGITLSGEELFANLRWIVNFLVPVPAFLFFESAGLLPRRGKLYTGILVSLFLGLAVATLIVGRQPVLHLINNVIVIAALPFILVRTYLQGAVDRGFVVIRRGLLCFVVLAVWDNTMGERWLHRTVEPYGFAVFLGCLGYVAARRTLRRDEELNEIQRELDLARRMQLSLLPAGFPESMSFRVAARYAPMSSVAGDLYEFLVADGKRAGLLIADVSGHGVPAALIASMVKMAALSQREHAEHPGRVLTGMNRVLFGSTQGQYVTAAYAHLDAERGEIRYAAAGHPAMLLLREGTVSEVAENGLVLAAAEGIEYCEKAVTLRPGDRVVLYTDGIVEARNRAGKMFGDEALMEAVRASASMVPEQVAMEVIRRVQAWAGSQEDDLTILVCDYTGL